ncbi:MAG: helix-turn-helix domain-containing protein [Ginsengibacter sp.]
MNLGFQYLGEGIFDVSNSLTIQEEKILKEKLFRNGYEVQKGTKLHLVAKMKLIISEMKYLEEKNCNYNFSYFLSSQLGYHYNYLANIFASSEGTNIQQYRIQKKVEKIKYLMIIENKNLAYIADILKYKSISHLSNQFKKVTGYSPSTFKHQHNKKEFSRGV